MIDLEEEPLPVVDKELQIKRLRRDAALARRLTSSLIPGLPVDADAPLGRVKTTKVGTLMDAVVEKLTTVKSTFFDTVCARWAELGADFPAKPGRYSDGHLTFFVRSSAQVFALYRRLPKLRKTLAALPDAPRRLTLHLEVHGI